MKTLGVTGGIGSGKTTVCGFLEEKGARVFYADLEAKRLMQEDEALKADIQDAFGEESYHADGSLNREYLAGEVFTDDDKLARLNALVHPRVFASFEQTAEDAREDGVTLLVHEAALLFEAGGDAHVDAVAVVTAPDADRIARVVERDDATPAQVKARMQHQLSQDDLRRRADHVIENDGTLDDLRRKASDLYWTVTNASASSK